MKGHEELVSRKYVDPKKAGKLRPEHFDKNLGLLQLGATTFRVLDKYLDISVSECDAFVPEVWKKSEDLLLMKPDSLIVRGKRVYGVVEHKTTNSINTPRARKEALEQLHAYLLVCKAKIGILSDGNSTYWIHNLDQTRKNEVKLISTTEGLVDFELTPENFSKVEKALDPVTDNLSQPEALDPSRVARSVWQSIYVATRESPERCFQTFVELFTYKLISDAGLLPQTMRLEELTVSAQEFDSKHGQDQISYYLEVVRERIKSHLFPPTAVPSGPKGIGIVGAAYRQSRDLFLGETGNEEHLSAAGATSVLDGHAFNKDPSSHNEAFLRILRKLAELQHVNALDRGFKSRVYEQFLRRDPNITKASGKYFTPRNVVRAIVEMGNVASLPAGSTICDPACGVGGFLTESMLALEAGGIKPLVETGKGKVDSHLKLLGLDCEYEIICLAKSNMLLHSLEFFKDLSVDGRKNYQDYLGETFIWCHSDTQLGSLNHPIRNEIDLVMANPPYIVSGTGQVSAKLKADPVLDNFYSAGGSGLESRFVNWIVNSLKPGGQAFVVLPKSMFARTERKLKEFLREQCDIECMIYLPSGVFYTTPVETYILGVKKKHDKNSIQKTPVFCHLVSEIGESRDSKREPTKNDLDDVVKLFKTFKAMPASFETDNRQCKLIDISVFSPDERWDIDYQWSLEEKRELGVLERGKITVDEVITQFGDVVEALKASKKALEKSWEHTGSTESVSLSDESRLIVHRGNRVTTTECKSNPGDVLVVASGRHRDSYFGVIGAEYLCRKFRVSTIEEVPGYFTQDRRVVSVGATGAVGAVHIRHEDSWFLHDDALAIEVIDPSIDIEYFRHALQKAINDAQYSYSAKLYQDRLKSLSVEIPLNGKGKPDRDAQLKLRDIYDQQEAIQSRVFRVVQGLTGTDITS